MEPVTDNVRPTTVRRRTGTTLALGTTTVLVATALVTGMVGPSGNRVGHLVAPSAAATELQRFSGCQDLRQWYVDAALPHVGPWGLDGAVWAESLDGARTTADLAGDALKTPDNAVGNGPTGTNVQEAGVDEPDLAKTDGSLVAHVRGRHVVLTDATGDKPRELSTLRLPRDLQSAELLLVGDRLVVLGTSWDWEGPMRTTLDVKPGRILPGGAGTTRVLVVDIGDPTAPEVEDDSSFDGGLVSARQYDGVVRLVVSTQSPAIDFVTPRRGRTAEEATRENRRLVRESGIDDWLPRVESDGTSSRLVGCGDVQHPRNASGYGTVTVVALDPGEPDARRTTAVTTGSDLVYSSTDRLYLATTQRRASEVHAFYLDGLDTTYVASGRVPGQVRDRWSFSEYDGHLRVATALGKDSWDPDENAVVVLEERGPDLVEVGRVARMGIREQIQSVRWFGQVAVVVTFRQTDPLYTLDLADPSAPRVVGKLKIPGFSAYLHPLGGDLLLGLGQDASRDGSTKGAQAAVFDLHDLADPRRVDTENFSRNTQFATQWDPRSVTYLPRSRTLLATIQDWNGGIRLVVLNVGRDGRLTRRPGRSLPGWDVSAVRTLPLDDGRVVLVAGRTLSVLEP